MNRSTEILAAFDATRKLTSDTAGRRHCGSLRSVSVGHPSDGIFIGSWKETTCGGVTFENGVAPHLRSVPRPWPLRGRADYLGGVNWMAGAWRPVRGLRWPERCRRR
jgi:hypothetical protein